MEVDTTYKKLIEIENEDVKRGSVGVATDGLNL